MPTGDVWNRPPPPGFRGIDPHRELTVYHRHLPHWRQDGATYFVTFRQADALPQAKLNELQRMRAEWERTVPAGGRTDDEHDRFTQEMMRRIETWLDQGHGSCLLPKPSCAEVVEQTLRHFDLPCDREESASAEDFNPEASPETRDVRYELGCFVIMPNHVHVVVRPLQSAIHPLEDILRSWKSWSGRRINEVCDSDGSFWQEESFDRIIRDEEHLYRVLRYIGRNPANAGLSDGQYRLWVRPSWINCGWDFPEK